METSLSWWTAGGRPKTSTKWKASTLPNAKHIPWKDWILLRELTEVGSWPSLQQRRWQQPEEEREWQTSEESPLEKTKSKFKPTLNILTFNQPHTPREVKSGYCLERVEQYVSAPPEVRQMPKIWTLQGSLPRMRDKGQVQWKGTGTHGRRLFKGN